MAGSIFKKYLAQDVLDFVDQKSQDAETAAKTYADTKVATEKSEREAADAALQTAINNEVAARQAMQTQFDELDAYAQDIRGDLDQELLDRAAGDAAVQSAVNSEQAARIAGDAALSLRIDANDSALSVLNGNSSVAGSVDAKVKAAVDGLINGASSAYDTLVEIQNIIQSDQSGAAAMLADIASHESRLDTLEGSGAGSVQKAADDARDAAKLYADGLKALVDADLDSEEAARILGDSTLQSAINSEQSARQSADSSLQSQITSLQSDVAALQGTPSLTGFKGSKTLSAGDVSNQYIDLPYIVYPGTLQLSVARVMLYEDEDYSLSTVGGVSRVTFSGASASSGAEALVSGDVLRFKALKQ